MYLVHLCTIVAHGFLGEHFLVERTPWINKVVFVVVGFFCFVDAYRFLGLASYQKMLVVETSYPVSFPLLSIEANFCRRSTW